MDYYKETEWFGLYVSVNGKVKNETGLECVIVRKLNGVFVGLVINQNTHLKKLAELVYINHIRNGKPIPPGFIVSYKDGNADNCSADNLFLRESIERSIDVSSKFVHKMQTQRSVK